MSARSLSGAYAHYVSLGADRSYKAVAAHFRASVRAVTKRAAREGWKDRLARHEARVRQVTDDRLLKAEIDRRLQLLSSLKNAQDRALRALQEFPIRSAMEAVEVLVTAIGMERAILGGLRLEANRVAESGPKGKSSTRPSRGRALEKGRRE